MISINVESSVNQMSRDLDRRLWSQLPFATAKGLTETAKAAQRAATKAIDDSFDRPIPFTRRAIGVSYANKRTLTATVFVKEIQAAYLGLEITGGTRLPKHLALLLPRGVTLNQYGNIPRGKIKALLARPDVFSGKVKGVGGIWQRTGKGLKLLVAYQPRAAYRARFPFFDVVTREVARTLDANLKASLALAIATAR